MNNYINSGTYKTCTSETDGDNSLLQFIMQNAEISSTTI